MNATWATCSVGLLLCIVMEAGAAQRYVAQFADGRRLEVATLPFWPLPSGNARWNGHELFPPGGSPLQLVRDREASLLLRPPFLVFANGDILSGTPGGLEASVGRYGEPLRLRVELESPLVPARGNTLAVRVDRIARIVGSDAITHRVDLPAGTVVLADGRRLTARSVRWRETSLSLLTAEGVVEVSYTDVSDIVLPQVDVPAAVLDDHLRTDRAGACIARYSLTNGAVLTSSRAGRVIQRTRGRGRMIEETYYLVQPAWAAAPVKFPDAEIAWCGYRGVNEVPLSLLPGETLVNRRLVATAEAWMRNRSPDGTVLASGTREADLGISAHSHSEIALQLPLGCQTFNTVVGIALAIQQGGCVRCKLFAENSSGKLLWQSGVLRGGDEPQATGTLHVAGLSRVVFVTEFAHHDRPPGADPLDIRDQVCWLAPLATIELSGARKAVMLSAALTGLQDWQATTDAGPQVLLRSIWNPEQECWDAHLTLDNDASIELTRKLAITPQNDVLELLTACPAAADQHNFELTVDGQPVPWHASADHKQIVELNKRAAAAVRKRDAGKQAVTWPATTLAYWWDLQAWRGQVVTLRLRVRGAQEKSEIAWRGFAHRAAVINLPASSSTFLPQIPLTELEYSTAGMPKSREPVKNALPPAKHSRLIRFLGQPFTQGWGMSRGSRATFTLRPEYDRFVAVVGCSEGISGAFRVLIDDQIVWERAAKSQLAPAEQVDLPLPPSGKTLTIEVGSDGDSDGAAAWANAGFMLRD